MLRGHRNLHPCLRPISGNGACRRTVPAGQRPPARRETRWALRRRSARGGAVAIPKGDIVFIRESYRSGEIPGRTKANFGTVATEQETYLVDSLTAVPAPAIVRAAASA
jgi:hypothetical protein